MKRAVQKITKLNELKCFRCGKSFPSHGHILNHNQYDKSCKLQTFRALSEERSTHVSDFEHCTWEAYSTATAEDDEGNSSSRYDFCDLGDSEFVHVLGILSLKGHDNDYTFFLIVADMCLCEQQSTSFPNDLYTYKTALSINGRARRKLTKSPIISCINIDTVVAPCCFTKLDPKPTEEEASVLTNIFVLFNIKYCDRSGWHSTTKADGINTIAGGRIKLLDDDQITHIVRAYNHNEDTTNQQEEDDDEEEQEEDTTGNEQDDDD
jgi:hypothetical protein